MQDRISAAQTRPILLLPALPQRRFVHPGATTQEWSQKLPKKAVGYPPGSFRNGHFYSTKSEPSKAPVSSDIGAFVREQIVFKTHLENPLTIFLPDGSQGRVWLGSGVIGDELHWRLNVKAVIGVDQDRLRFAEKPPATADYNPHGPTPGALQGDDYPLEYYEDGYPKLPACLDRRTKPYMAEAA